MELRSGRSLRRSPPPQQHGARCQRRRGPDLEADRLSALPNEMLLLVLARLGCTRAAVQTSLLSRRWHSLWTDLTDLSFHGLTPATIQQVLAGFSHSSVVSLFDVHLPFGHGAAAQANSLLRSAARLSPGKLVFTLLEPRKNEVDIELPCFPSTTSIELDTHYFLVRPPPAGEFTALDTLIIYGRIVGLGDFLNRCPRLRVISVVAARLATWHGRCLGVVVPPGSGEFTALESLSLTGSIAGLSSLLSHCQHLRVLSVTYMDSQQLTLPPDGEFAVLEKLSLSGNIVNLTTSLNRCPRLRVLSVTFRGVTLCSLEAALDTLEASGPFGFQLSLLGFKDIRPAHNNNNNNNKTPCLASLLRTAGRLSPQEFLFVKFPYKIGTEPLPSFRRTTSIEMNIGLWIDFDLLPDSDFSHLQRLSLSGGCSIVNLTTLLTLCPRLRELRLTVTTGIIEVHSESLQKLHVSTLGFTHCSSVDIFTPELKELKLEVHDDGDMSVSILAPTVKNVCWERFHIGLAPVFRFWSLRCLRLETACSFGVLCLHISASKHLGAKRVFTKQMEKFLVAVFSVLEVHLEEESEHRFGALVMCLFRMRQICATAKKLKVVPPCTQRIPTCQGTCPCDGSKKWKNKNIYSTCLEEVEVENFNGDDCDHDFLTLILRCSPMLKRVSLKLSSVGHCTSKVDNIILAYPSVTCYVYFPSGKLARRVSGELA